MSSLNNLRPNKQLIYSSQSQQSADPDCSSGGSGCNRRLLNIIHFNDVYNMEARESEPCGGSSRFVTLVDHMIEYASSNNTIVLFSGDALAPAFISMRKKGKNMIEVLNHCRIVCACLGNHDFDFGTDSLKECIELSNFPWILSNVFDKETRKPLCDVADNFIMEFNGIKIGIIGLVEFEWISTLFTLNVSDVIYESFSESGRRLATELKRERNCDMVIALTHMRWPNDCLLAESVPEIDLILGGHDHEFKALNSNGKWIIKSGTDFREFGFIQLSIDQKIVNDNNNNFNKNKMKNFIQVNKIEKLIVDSTIQPKQEVEAIVDSYMKCLNEELDEPLGDVQAELDGRFASVRSNETNLGNFVCDILWTNLGTDLVLLNSGTFRSDCVHTSGLFKVRDLKKILPKLDECVIISCRGAVIYQALENSVSQYPKLEGRFPQVSGIRFSFDASKQSGHRVCLNSIEIHGKKFDLNRDYSMLTKKYLKMGKDGYECLVDCPVLFDSESLPAIYTIVENHFRKVQAMKSGQMLTPSWISIKKFMMDKRADDSFEMKLNETEENLLKMKPTVEGRIIQQI